MRKMIVKYQDMGENDTPECSVVIPVYNNPEGCKALIRDFYRIHSKEIDKFRFIVIDQTEHGMHFEEGCPVHLHIRAYRNLGFSKAMNTGWKLAGTPYTLLANDDIRLLDARWYEDAKAHLSDEGVLGVNPFPALRTWNAGGEPTWYYDDNPEKFAWTKDIPFEAYEGENYEKLQELLKGGDPPGTTYFFPLFRTEARDIVGYLDEAYINNGEDYDHNRRIFLTCRHCKKRKHEHVNGGRCGFPKDGLDKQFFEPYKIITCTHSLVHHQCGVTKQNAVAAKEYKGYDLVANAKNIFHKKWGDGADIYGKQGLEYPNTPWWQEIDL